MGEESRASNVIPEIRVDHNGPYTVSDVAHFTNWLGEELPLRSISY